MASLFQAILMLIITAACWGGLVWLIASESGQAYTKAQRENVGNCWPACKPTKAPTHE